MVNPTLATYAKPCEVRLRATAKAAGAGGGGGHAGPGGGRGPRRLWETMVYGVDVKRPGGGVLRSC